MRAIFWLRFRQEQRELSYWLSYVFFEMDDHSLNNKLYLLYLILFFSVWIFITLLFFASGGAKLLILINSQNPADAAASLTALFVGLWFLNSIWHFLKHSPITFSEEDAFILNQTPASRSFIVLRWLWMPWFKSALPFWLITIILGYSVAETVLAGQNSSAHILEYIGYGMRSWLVMIPFHLSLYILIWMMGVSRLQQDKFKNIFLRIAFFCTLFGFSLIRFFFQFPPTPSLIYPLQIGFSTNSILFSLTVNLLVCLVLLFLLTTLSRAFNLTRAIQETQETVKIKTAQRTGDETLIQQLSKQKILGVAGGGYAWLPAYAGKNILIWKDWLQSLRTFQVFDLFHWIFLFGCMLGFSQVADQNSKIFLFTLWIIQIGKAGTARFREDLKNWVILRQLPIFPKNIILGDLSSAYCFAVILSLLALIPGLINLPVSNWGIGILIPPTVASIAFVSMYDICRQARADDLLDNYAPTVSVVGLLLSFVIAGFPYLIYIFLPGVIGLFFSLLLSVGLAYFAFHVAIRAYQKIG